MSDTHISLCYGKGTSCSCQPRLKEALVKYFGFSSFRPGQMEASQSVLHGKDVFVRMSTGSGKSLCMFLGPLCRSKEAIAVIISPLNGLMEQQVKLLHGAGISAAHVNGTCSYDSAANGEYRFVFISPELVVRSPWRKIFQTPHFKEHLALVAIDEAHCIPEWGSDFRTAFKCIGGLRALTSAPFMALSASAPPSIAKAIEESLHLKSPVQVLHGLDRPNIFFSWSKSKGLAWDLAGLVSALGHCSSQVPKTIVFCTTKNYCSKIYYSLSGGASDKHAVSMYHASLTHGTKSKVHDEFKCGTRLRCLTATVAFGMGMDIPDVELVVIYGIPGTVSQLYQLCGRAGRGGCQSRAHWILNSDETKISDPTLKKLVTDTENCLRSTLINALGGSVEQHRSKCCMVCDPSAFTDGGRLDVLQVGRAPPRKKRRVAVRRVDAATTKALQAQLEEERAKYISNNPHLCIVGPQLVCPDSTIATICSSAKFLSVISVFILEPNSRRDFLM